MSHHASWIVKKNAKHGLPPTQLSMRSCCTHVILVLYQRSGSHTFHGTGTNGFTVVHFYPAHQNSWLRLLIYHLHLSELMTTLVSTYCFLNVCDKSLKVREMDDCVCAFLYDVVLTDWRLIAADCMIWCLQMFIAWVAGEQTAVPKNMEQQVNALTKNKIPYVKLKKIQSTVMSTAKWKAAACEVPMRFWKLKMPISGRRLGA